MSWFEIVKLAGVKKLAFAVISVLFERLGYSAFLLSTKCESIAVKFEIKAQIENEAL
jgi:hypothetical protein